MHSSFFVVSFLVHFLVQSRSPVLSVAQPRGKRNSDYREKFMTCLIDEAMFDKHTDRRAAASTTVGNNTQTLCCMLVLRSHSLIRYHVLFSLLLLKSYCNGINLALLGATAKRIYRDPTRRIRAQNIEGNEPSLRFAVVFFLLDAQRGDTYTAWAAILQYGPPSRPPYCKPSVPCVNTAIQRWRMNTLRLEPQLHVVVTVEYPSVLT